MRTADIVVVGLGTMGSMALWQLASTTGRSVLGLEQHGPVHPNGAYAGESRLFRVAAKEGELYVPLLQRARQLWLDLEHAAGEELLLKCGLLSLGTGTHPDVIATQRAIADFDLPHELLGPEEVRRRYPQFHVESDDIGILDPQAGGLRPERAVVSATREALKHGAQVQYNTEVTGIDVRGEHVIVSTSTGTITARHVVLTAGASTTQVMPELRELLRVSTYSLSWLMPKNIALFTPDRFPVFLRDLHDTHAFGAPTLDGYSIKFCPTQRQFEQVDSLSDAPRTMSDEHLRWIGQEAERLIPDLIPAPVRWSLHSDSETADKMPIIDQLEDGKITIAAGMSGYGFKFAPLYGHAIAELVTTGESRWQHELFTFGGHAAPPGEANAR